MNIAGCGSYTAYNPWTAPVYPEHSSAGSLSAPAELLAPAKAGDPIDGTLAAKVATPVISGTSILKAYTDRFNGVHAPRLFLKTVYYDSATAEKLKARVAAGFSKQLTFSTSDHFKQTILAGAAPNGINWPFTQSVIRPTRLWVFPLYRDSKKIPALGSSEKTFPARTGPICLKNTNIMLNGDNFYNNPFKTQWEFYREFRRQLLCGGASMTTTTPISYSDFISGSALYCFDLSRNLSVQTNGTCALTLTSDLWDQNLEAVPADDIELNIIVERMMTVTLKVSLGGVEVLVKKGAD
jgi:hypothetical protein